MDMTMHLPHALMKSSRIKENSKAANREMSDIFHDALISLTN